MKRTKIGRYLVREPDVCHGKLTFRGTRVPVETVLSRLGKRRSIEDILSSWPELKRAAIAEAINLAAASLLERYPGEAEAVDEPTHS